MGARPAGLAAALRLHQQTDITCTFYELRPEPTTLGGAIGILSSGLRLLHRLGVYDKGVGRGYRGFQFDTAFPAGPCCRLTGLCLLGARVDWERVLMNQAGQSFKRSCWKRFTVLEAQFTLINV